MVGMLIEVMCEAQSRSGYKKIADWYSTQGRLGGDGNVGNCGDGSNRDNPQYEYQVNGRRKVKPAHFFHQTFRPHESVANQDPAHPDYGPPPHSEQMMYRRCVSLCIQTLLHLSYLYTDAAPSRMILDWFPEKEDISGKFIKLLSTLTCIVNTHKMLAAIFKKDVEEENGMKSERRNTTHTRNKDHQAYARELAQGEKFGYNVDECNYVSRMCKALYRSLREAKADDSFTSEAHTFQPKLIKERQLFNNPKLHELGTFI